jgi:ABC-type phosphate transport system auxiliary subunit
VLLIDDILLAPVHGLLWVARQIDDAVRQEQDREEEELQARLRELHQRLEAGQLTEAEFEAQEAQLLDRLDALAERKGATASEAEDSFFPEDTGDEELRGNGDPEAGRGDHDAG